MALPTATEISDLGFTFEMFALADMSEFDAVLNSMLTEQGTLLSVRIGSAAYASSDETISALVKRALKCLVAAELCQRRINRLARDVKMEDGADAKKMRQNRSEYLAEADSLVGQIAAGAKTDSGGFSSRSVVTSHFPEFD